MLLGAYKNFREIARSKLLRAYYGALYGFKGGNPAISAPSG
jgi:hypothetical protein